MRKRSKRYKECEKEIDHAKCYAVAEAVDIMKSLKAVKFDESVDIALKLGIDPKKSDQLIRGAFSLPNGTGKKPTIIVFTTGENVDKAKKAGASEVGAEELIKKVQGGWLDFDVAISSPELMREVGKLGKVLGPQGKMPSPKSGTVTKEIEKTVKEFMAGKIEFKTDAAGCVHGLMGKVSFPAKNLVENIQAFTKHIVGLRPTSSKGTFLLKASMSSSMGQGLLVDLQNL
ncbi:MAG: 50S ribosomal protein L1 [Candidatus Anammoxibacter sp.]